jgi:MraZ protein
MFMGEYEHSLDAKGRLIIPSKLRGGLGERCVATKGLDSCLFVYPVKEWEAIESRLRELPFTRADVRSFVRLFFSGATECELDPQGRILLAQNLRDYARIEKDVMIIGALSRVEIWARPEWEEYRKKAEGGFSEIAEKIIDF